MKSKISRILLALFIAGFLLTFVPAVMALGPGEGNILKRGAGSGASDELCHACHKTYRNAPSDPDAIKSHSSTSTSKWPAGWGITTGKYGEIVCTTCHTGHDTTNIYLIKETITAPNAPTDAFPGSTVDFRRKTGIAGDVGLMADDTACFLPQYSSQGACQTGGGTWNPNTNACYAPNASAQADCTTLSGTWTPRTTSTRVCEVCHSKNRYHNYNATNNPTNGGNFSHNNAGDCNSCHPHKEAFLPAGGGACNSCHGQSGTTGAPLIATDLVSGANATGSTNAGKHSRHAVSLNYPCNTCHTGYVMPDSTNHAIDIGFDNFGSGGGAYKGQSTPNVNYTGHNGTNVSVKDNSRTCSSIYCHSNAQGTNGAGAPSQYATPAWLDSAPATNCGSCHLNMSTDATGTGSHLKHANTSNYNMVCSNCHTGYTATTTNASLHVNHTIDVAIDASFGGTYSGGTVSGDHSPGGGYGSCSTVYCHSDGRVPANYASPSWGGSVNCGSCHGDATTLATGSHTKHLVLSGVTCAYCHNATATGSTVINSYTNHANKNVTMNFNASAAGASGAYNGNTAGGATVYQKAIGTAAGTCSTTICHGGISGTWGVADTNDTCTKCHGTPTLTVTVANRYVVAPPRNTAGQSGSATDTGQVSNDVKVGAHQTHLQYFNGLRSTANDTNDDRCGYCHGTLPTSGLHANGSSTPAFQGLATHSGTMTASYVGTTCNNTYCHNPAATGGSLDVANAGTGINPSWTDATYIANAPLQTQANCGKCHKVPGDVGFTSTYNHTGITVGAGACTSCHGHSGDTTGAAGQRHLDGIKYGGGNCNSCHDYDVNGATYTAGVWTGGTWGKSVTGSNPEGFGAHAKHINHLKTRLGYTGAMTPTGQTFGAGEPQNICGTCHTNTVGNHAMSGSTTRTINFGDSTYKYGGATGFSFLFDPAAPTTNPPIYNGNSTTSSSVNPKSCSSVSCHFQTSPVWSAY